MRTPEQTRVRMIKWAEKVYWYKNAEQRRLSQIERARIFDDICTARHELYMQKQAKRRWWQFL